MTRGYKSGNRFEVVIERVNHKHIVLVKFWDSIEDNLVNFQWRQEGDESGALGKLGAIMAEEPKFTWANIKKTY